MPIELFLGDRQGLETPLLQQPKLIFALGYLFPLPLHSGGLEACSLE